MSPSKFVALCYALAILSACSPGARNARQAGSPNPNDWATVGGGADESSFSRLTKINRDNVSRLGLAWSLDLPGEQSLEAPPLAVNGVLYFSGTYSTVYAVDATTGKLLWRYDPKNWEHAPQKLSHVFSVNRGVAYSDGRVFVATFDGRLIALDAASGKPLWAVETLPADLRYTSTGAPRVFKDKVIIGNAGADWGARGYVTAYDVRTGRQAWRFYTAPGSPEQNRADPAAQRAAATWGGQYWKTGTGGTVWNGITFDPDLNRVYIGTGNSGPYNPRVRSPGGGDNLYLASIVALDADTGNYIWHYQVNPREAWDFKATANMVAATVDIDGKPRKVLMQAPTNGFFYVLDRETGKLISAEKIGKVTWASRIDLATGRPIEAPNIRYETGETVMWPSPFGAHNWQPMSYDPATGLVYIPYMQIGVRYRTLTGAGVAMGGLSITPVRQDGDDGKGALLAWDPVAQKPRWKVRRDTFWNGGVLSTAGGLVFQGAGDGRFSAYDAESGRPLWQFDAGLGINAAPITYTVNDRQYVSVLVGYGGAVGGWSEILNAGWKYNAQPRRLLTFVLGGDAKLPPTPPRDFQVHAVDNPKIAVDPADAAAGRALFNSHCNLCHGTDARSAGAPAPDLRESLVPQDLSMFKSVLGGERIQSGMPRFDMFSDGDVRRLRSFIISAARDARRGV